MNPLRPISLIFIAAFFVSLVIAAGILYRLYERIGDDGEALVGGPFLLFDQHGKPISDKDLRGQFLLIYFGYTFCPDACPTSLTTMSKAIEYLGDKGDRVTPVFITLDPARDTQEALLEYVKPFHPRLLALWGSEDAITAVAHSYRVYFSKVDNSDPENYLLDHTSFLYLMGPNGKYLAHFPLSVKPEEIAAVLEKDL